MKFLRVKLKKIKATHHNGRKIVLPEPALNDVFIGETLSSRVSYYEIQCDGAESVKQKSSGIVVCTGSIFSGTLYSVKVCLRKLLP